MARVITESIYYRKGTDLAHRSGSIRLDRRHSITSATSFEDTLHVRRGLQPHDLAVFFGVEPSKADLREGRFDPLSLQFGYLVGALGTEACQATLVRGDTCDADPAVWVTDYIRDTWTMLSESCAPDEFSLFGLAAYLAAQRTPESQQSN